MWLISLVLRSGNNGGVAESKRDVHDGGQFFKWRVAVGLDDERVISSRACAELVAKLFEVRLFVFKIHGGEWRCDDADDERIPLRGEQEGRVRHRDAHTWLQKEGGA